MTPYDLIIVKEFNSAPYGRTIDVDGDTSGEAFRRRILVPALLKHGSVHVVLDGYNRYGRSFLDEAFGGLIREEGFTAKDLEERLTYSHSLVKSIEEIIADRISAAARDMEV
ncbi:DUF4325 domain-containing protein [Halopseudomonas laoshanensis]|uniref:DUF4325 domain-containing protein n=1 Tax=Halopseudomonas laoshanensis TaxID=2268758 RepID=A0A7V7KY31_9GAMM|nr:STAS-like domain-containing protein [Halopseudomonas laoshanensis]KAA0696327.1 DUF4325 domain-containing protein [Halopseudomonas laoshanensis]